MSFFLTAQRNRYWPLISMLAMPQADQSKLATLLADRVRTAAEAEMVAEFVDLSKVIELALYNIRKLDGYGQLEQLLSESAASRESKRLARQALATRVIVHTAATDGAIIKGNALARYYEDPAMRHRGDVDVWYPSAEGAMALVSRLWDDDACWQWDRTELPWLKWDEDEPYGQFKIRREIPGSGTAMKVDIHYGGFSVGHLGLLPVRGFEKAAVDGVPVQVPVPENDIAILVAHASGDSYTSLKDLNDLSQIVAGRNVDWDEVYRSCEQAVLAPVLNWLLGLVRERSGPAGLPAVEKRPARPLPLLDASKWERAVLTARTAYADVRQQGGPLSAAKSAGSALRYYTTDLSVRTAGSSSRERFDRSRAVCWRLVPEPVWRPLLADPSEEVNCRAAGSLLPGMEILRADQDWVVRHRDEVLIPTVSGRIPLGALRLASSVSSLDAGGQG